MKVGAGIPIPPNSACLLYSQGLGSALQQKSIKPTAIIWRRWSDGNAIGRARLNPDCEEQFGSPYYIMYRACLHEVLYNSVQELDVPVVLGRRVVKYTVEIGAITFDDGAVMIVDLILADNGRRLDYPS